MTFLKISNFLGFYIHCAYHQGLGHTTDQCTALRHAVQDLIDQGIVQLGQPSISSNPLLNYSTHAVPPPAGGIHSIDFDEFEDRIHMLSWDDQRLKPIAFDDGYGDDGVHEVFSSQQIHSHVVSTSGITPVWIPTLRPVTLPCYSV